MLAMASSARDREPSLAARAAAASRLRAHGPDDAGRAEVEAFIRAHLRRALRRRRDAIRARCWSACPTTTATGRRGRLPRGATAARCSSSATCAAPVRRCWSQRPSAAAARAPHRRGRPPRGQARRRRPAPDPAAGAAPGGARLRVGGRHADRRSCASCSCASASRRWRWARRSGRAGRRDARWGSYYEHRPVVLAGHRRRPCRPLRARAQRCLRPALDDGRRTWSAAELAGRTRSGCAAAAPAGTRVLATCWTTGRPGWCPTWRPRGRRGACAAAAVLHAGADRHALRAAGVDTLLAARRWPRLAGAAPGQRVALAGRALRAAAPAGPRRAAARGHGQDHLHLGHHRRAQGRVPGGAGHAARRRRPGARRWSRWTSAATCARCRSRCCWRTSPA